MSEMHTQQKTLTHSQFLVLHKTKDIFILPQLIISLVQTHCLLGNECVQTLDSPLEKVLPNSRFISGYWKSLYFQLIGKT